MDGGLSGVSGEQLRHSGGQVRTRALGSTWCSHSLFSLQMMMQYLYHGGTESMHIPTADILEVSLWPAGSSTEPSAHLSGLEPETPARSQAHFRPLER